MITKHIKRGDIHWVDFGETNGSEQGGIRPAIIIQNNVGNKYSPTVIVCPISSEIKKKELPTHVCLDKWRIYGLTKPSQVITEQIRTRDKSQLGDYIGFVDSDTMDKIDRAIEISVQVGSAKESVYSRELKVIKDKVEEIEDLDKFIKMWFTKNDDTDRIKGYLLDRELAIKDLELYADKYNLNYREFYNPMMKNNERVDRVRMVG